MLASSILTLYIRRYVASGVASSLSSSPSAQHHSCSREGTQHRYHKSMDISQEYEHITRVWTYHKSTDISQEYGHITRVQTYHKSMNISQEYEHMVTYEIVGVVFYFF